MRKLNAWREAGLIDEVTAERIRAFEAEHARPLALWAVIGVGALAIGLGVISVVAANWEDVPGQVRLAVHFALLAALTAFLAMRGEHLERDHPWGLEAGLFMLGVLGMAFFGHLGQVYQTGSPLWKPLAAWLVLFGPLLLLRGQSWLAAVLVMGTLIFACFDHAFGFDDSFLLGRVYQPPYLWMAVITAVPVLMTPLASFLRGRSVREAFWIRIEQIGLAFAVGGASLVASAAGIDQFPQTSDGAMDLQSQFVRAAIALVAGLMVAVLRPNTSGRMAGAIIAATGIVFVLSYPVSGGSLLPALLFLALWAGIAAAALNAGWRGVFQLAVAAVALRLIVLSFELASDLLASGFGLILAGLLILGIAWAAVRISRQYAPSAGGAK